MNSIAVVFIVVKEYENLGIGYISSVLSVNGYKTQIIDFNSPKRKILLNLRRIKPLIVGFSVIYQYYIDKFKELVEYLRTNDINCHFTAGGHYASIMFSELFEIIPGIDSVVRFEGEYSMLELVDCIYKGSDWRGIQNIVFRNNNALVNNPLRPLLKNLDTLPYPVRKNLTNYAFNKKFALIIAGRGCVHNCSFCNLRAFYLRNRDRRND